MAGIKISKLQDLNRSFSDNVERNKMLSHIKYVEEGLRPVDEKFQKYIKIKKYLVTLEKYQNWKSRQA